ncbi:MAG TPA: permease prefix domain 1-containing protein [Pseudogracilibacillus sp.]|nr:permease prefix domain 1-containing protein [Pseudogracilibacillus sp.]
MNLKIRHQIELVLQEIDGSKEEKEDLFWELKDHLQLSSEAWMNTGLSEEKAIDKAIEDFGNAEKVGREIQKAMYPLRKILLVILATLSLLYTFSLYLIELFMFGDAHYAWLLFSVASSSLLLVIALQLFASFDRKFILNSILIVHAFIYLLGVGFSSSLSIVAWAIVIFTISLIYRTTLLDYDFRTTEVRKPLKLFHLYNITIGLIIIGVTLFFTSVLLAFADEFTFSMLFFLTPFVIWLVVYYIQINLVMRKHIVIAVCVGILPLAIILLLAGIYLFEVYSVEVMS